MIYDWFTLDKPIAHGEFTIVAVEVEAYADMYDSWMVVNKVRAASSEDDSHEEKEYKASVFGVDVSDIDGSTMDTIIDCLRDECLNSGHEGEL